MATVTWIGKQQVTREVRPYTLGGTVVGGTFGFTINGKTVSVAGDTDAATTAPLLHAALIASGEPEFTECTFSYSGAVVTITGPTDGAPITVTTVTGGGSSLTAGSVTTGTSPNHLVAANFLDGALPGNSDTVEIPANSADIMYNLDAMTSITGLVINVREGGPKIGLQDWKAPGYREYRKVYLEAALATLNVELGDRTGYRELRFDVKVAATTAVTVVGRQSTTAGQETCEIVRPGGSSSFTCKINGGSVALNPGAGGSLNLSDLTALNCTASVGAGITVTALTYIQAGGYVDSSFTTLALRGGTVEVRGTATGTPTVDEGTLSWKGTGQLTNCELGSGATVDTSAGVGAITVGTSIVMNEGSTINDPAARLTTPVIQLRRTGVAGVTINIGEHFKLTKAAF